MLTLSDFNTSDIITLSVVGFFGLLTVIIFILTNITIFCSKGKQQISTPLKVCSFIACGSALVMVSIDVTAVLHVIDGNDITQGIQVNFILPLSSFSLKIFVYFIFIGQLASLSQTDLIYRTSRTVITYIYALISISILCVALVIIVEVLIASNAFNEDTLRSIYKWDFVALNINEFILSISVICVFASKLIIALRFEKIGNKQDAFVSNNNAVNYVDETKEINLGYAGQTNVKKGGYERLADDNNQQNADHYEYKYKQSGAVDVSKSSIVHVMLRLVVLSIFCIIWVELLFAMLLLKRVMNFDFDAHIFEVGRSVQALCGAMACLCIWLHFNANYKVYDCCCRCCHGCCLSFCLKCVAVRFKKKSDVIGPWGKNKNTLEWNYTTYVSMSQM